MTFVTIAPTPAILVVEDDADLRTALDVLLSSHGFSVTATDTGEAALAAAQQRPPDVVILDVNLPGINGPEVCRRLRLFSSAPVLFLTGAIDVADELVGFSAGADDYIRKPFTPQLLVARVQAHLRRSDTASTDAVVHAANVQIDRGGRTVTVDGAEVDLTRIEYQILALLAENVRRIISRDQLIEGVWGSWFTDDHIIDVNLSRLRQKLARAGAPAKLISTHRGLGYRLNP